MGSIVLRTAAVLIIAAGTILGGYWIYIFFEDVFEAVGAPLIVRLAVVAGGLGFAVLFLYVIWDRLRQIKGERFEDRD